MKKLLYLIIPLSLFALCYPREYETADFGIHYTDKYDTSREVIDYDWNRGRYIYKEDLDSLVKAPDGFWHSREEYDAEPYAYPPKEDFKIGYAKIGKTRFQVYVEDTCISFELAEETVTLLNMEWKGARRYFFMPCHDSIPPVDMQWMIDQYFQDRIAEGIEEELEQENDDLYGL